MLFKSYRVNKNLRPAAAYEPVQKHKVTPSTLGWLNYVPNEHEDAEQYDSYANQSKIMPYQSYPKSLVNQNEIPIELSC